MSGTDEPSWEQPQQGQPWGPPGGGPPPSGGPTPGSGSPPYGSPPPGSPPQYGAPPGAPQWAPPGYGWNPPPPQKTSGVAIAALVLGLLWVFGLGSIGAIIFGIVALRQINRSGGTLGGRGLAISGIVLGALGVVVLPLLAAIAIPVFLNQRELAWDAAAKSDLKNAQIVQESAYVETGAYTTDVEVLEDLGFEASAFVELTIVEADADSYCMEAHYRSSTSIWHLDSTSGTPQPGRC